MISFRQAAEGELDFIKAFAQEAFNEYDFAQMLPKLYADNAKSEKSHYILYDGEEVNGLFALQIKDFCIADVNVRVGWLGSVCVKSKARGKGCLSHIMQYADTILKQNSCDIAVLGGQRQRYKRFGYEYGGMHWVYVFTCKNLQLISAEDYFLQPLDKNSKWFDEAYALYCNDKISAARTKQEFCAVLSSWKSQPYVIVKGNTFTGYCSLQICESHGQIYEMRLKSSAAALNACKAILNECKKESIEIFQCLWADTKTADLLSEECESARLAENHSFKVFNWQKIILAGLRLKAKCNIPMQTGTVFIYIENSGAYKITVAEEISVQSCEKSDVNVNLHFTQIQAVSVFLGHTSLRSFGIPAGWLPLPLGFSWLDGI